VRIGHPNNHGFRSSIWYKDIPLSWEDDYATASEPYDPSELHEDLSNLPFESQPFRVGHDGKVVPFDEAVSELKIRVKRAKPRTEAVDRRYGPRSAEVLERLRAAHRRRWAKERVARSRHMPAKTLSVQEKREEYERSMRFKIQSEMVTLSLGSEKCTVCMSGDFSVHRCKLNSGQFTDLCDACCGRTK
jgi:hypothetical protein